MQKFENSYGRENVRSGKCLSGEMSSRGSVRTGKCPFGEMFVGEVSVGEVSVGDLSSGKCQSGKCPVGKLSYNPSFRFHNTTLQQLFVSKINHSGRIEGFFSSLKIFLPSLVQTFLKPARPLASFDFAIRSFVRLSVIKTQFSF